jgi:predicted amidohydrolase YtcJ
MCNACDTRFMSFMRAYQGRRGVLGGMAASLVAAAVPAGEVLAQGMAERIFLARAIHTVDDAQRTVQAVAVRGGRIVALGARDEVLGLRGARTEVVDFGDATVLPGFVEPHMHSNFASLRPWLDVGPFTTADMDAARGKIRAAAAQAGPGGWVQAKMLDPSIMPGRPFDRASLDAVSPDVPVFALEANGHVAYVNSKAIALAGVTRDTPDPPQARFVRDASGALTGRLEEPNAFQPFVAIMPSPTPGELAALLRADWTMPRPRGARRCTIAALAGCSARGIWRCWMR